MAIDPYSPEVVGTLENLISPGTHSRMSPLVEAAQVRVLEGWLGTQAEMVRSWAGELWSRRCRANELSQVDYDDDHWLRACLAYYFPFGVAKLQLLFLDLVRMRRLSGDIRLFDIGIGAGSTFVGFLDFAIP